MSIGDAAPRDLPRLHVAVQGEGAPVLFLHGFAGSARNWRPQLRALAGRYETIAYDARGHARSDAPDDPAAYDAEKLVGDALRVLREAGADSAVWVGLSMGAAVAIEAALRRPEAVRALLIASPPAGRGAARGISAHALAFADAIEREGIDAAGSRFAWGPGSGLDAKGAALVRQGFLEHPAHGLAHTLRGFLGRWPPLAERRAELARIEAPALVVLGALDAASRDAGEALAAALPHARLEVVEDAGHVVNLARPDAFDRLLLSFLAETVG